MKLPPIRRGVIPALFALLCAIIGRTAEGAETTITAEPRMSICLNGEWEIAPIDDDAAIAGEGSTTTRIPAAPILDPKVIGQWCRLILHIPKEWAATDRRFFVEFEKVGHYAEVFWNGRKVGEHFGQYSPFEFDVTDALRIGRRNDLTVFVHNASGKYVRPGANITEDMVANAYRPAANDQSERNWVGIAGDVTLSWRPAHGIKDVFVDTSVRKKMLTASVETGAPENGTARPTLHATVLDGPTSALELPPAALAPDGHSTLTRAWTNPVLWGSAPMAIRDFTPCARNWFPPMARVVDRVFTLFGFREVWVSGQDVLLNGRKLWLAGTYFGKHSPIRELDDRRPIAAMIDVMRNAGLNTVHGHWDDLGRPWLDLCDETGMFVFAGFFCDGRPLIQSRGEAGWAEWMNATCGEWVRAWRRHPSILLWRPTDVPPPQITRFISLDDFHAGLAAEVRQNDPSHRPIADGSDIAAWGQPPEVRETGEFTNFALLQTNHDSGKPFLCKEIYGGFNQPERYKAFAEEYYRRSFALGSTGLLVQQLPLLRNAGAPYAISWPSASGTGNRNTSIMGFRNELPNWSDPHSPAPAASPFAELFHNLFAKYMGVEPKPAPVVTNDVLVTGLSPRSFVFLAPENDTTTEPRGLLAAPDGTAWFAAVAAGPWLVVDTAGLTKVNVTLPSTLAPGYSQVQHVDAARHELSQ